MTCTHILRQELGHQLQMIGNIYKASQRIVREVEVK